MSSSTSLATKVCFMLIVTINVYNEQDKNKKNPLKSYLYWGSVKLICDTATQSRAAMFMVIL